jgi:hypothetical protein
MDHSTTEYGCSEVKENWLHPNEQSYRTVHTTIVFSIATVVFPRTHELPFLNFKKQIN